MKNLLFISILLMVLSFSGCPGSNEQLQTEFNTLKANFNTLQKQYDDLNKYFSTLKIFRFVNCSKESFEVKIIFKNNYGNSIFSNLSTINPESDEPSKFTFDKNLITEVYIENYIIPVDSSKFTQVKLQSGYVLKVKLHLNDVKIDCSKNSTADIIGPGVAYTLEMR